MSSAILYFSTYPFLEVFYKIGNSYFNAKTLKSVDASNLLELKRSITLLPLIQWESHPIFIQTNNGWIIGTSTTPDSFIIKSVSSLNALCEPIKDLRSLRIPFNGEILPIFDEITRDILIFGQFNRQSLSELKISFDIKLLDQQNLTLTSFDFIADKLRQGLVSNYQLDPLLQYWAGPNNTIMIFETRDGAKYLVKVRYQSNTNQIYPPV